MLILDFAGVSADLDLISADTFLDEPKPKHAEEEDIFKEPEGESEEPEETFAEGPNLNLRAIAKGTTSSTTHSYDEFNPFEASGSRSEGVEFKLTNSELGREPSISPKQYKLLCRNGVDDESLTAKEAQKLVGYIAQQGFKLWAPQIGILKKLHREIIAERDVFRE